MKAWTSLPVLIALHCLASPVSSLNLVITPFISTVELGEEGYFLLSTRGGNKTSQTIEVTVRFVVNHPDILELKPQEVTFWTGNESCPQNITIHPLHLGHAQVTTNVTPSGVVSNDDVYIDVSVELLNELGLISFVVGWIYFVAWSISFYPQILENWKRKSVVGLNFDFLSLNLIGFTLYSVFNCGLFWSKLIQKEYHARYPRSANAVFLNDVVFSLHATIATVVAIIQCFLYERGDQKVSITASVIMVVFALVVGGTAACAAFGVFLWLDFLYICSYIKLTITLIKYVPQAYMNYKRKSTIGWSVGNVLLDFTGGVLSMLQMVINCINLNDWESIFGDPTKFGLGLFSVVFDIFFMIQHFVLYRIPSSSLYEVLPGNDYPNTEPEDILKGESTEETANYGSTVSEPNITEVKVQAHSSLHEED